MENVRLTYFNMNGRVGLIRAMLCYKKIPFENKMITMEEWKTVKKNYEFEQLPLFEANNKKMTQTLAICLYIARHLNLYPKDIDLQYQIESLLCCRDDFTLMYRPIKFKEANDEMKKNYKDKLILYLKKFEERYIQLGSNKYFLGNDISLADFFLGVMIVEFCYLVKDEDILSKYAPKINQLIDNLKKNELKEFYEKYYIPLE